MANGAGSPGGGDPGAGPGGPGGGRGGGTGPGGSGPSGGGGSGGGSGGQNGGGSGAGGAGGGAGGAASNASIDDAIAELRRQFDITQGNIDPFIQAGTQALPGFIQGSTVSGFDARLAEILGTEAFQTLRDERTGAIQGQLAAGGLTRSGTAISEVAKIPTDVGLGIESLISNRLGNLVSGGVGAAFGLGELGARQSGQIADITVGESRFQRELAANENILNKQASAAKRQQLIGAVATAAFIGFSDPRLKENVEQIGNVGDLALYSWDWIKGAAGTVVENCGKVGFMADQVARLYPRHVSEFCGFMVIDYPSLLTELEA